MEDDNLPWPCPTLIPGGTQQRPARDRSEASHAINLCDMQAKYADVLKVEDLQRYLASLPKGLFDRRRGS